MAVKRAPPHSPRPTACSSQGRPRLDTKARISCKHRDSTGGFTDSSNILVHVAGYVSNPIPMSFFGAGVRSAHEFKSLFRFSLRFNLSTRLRCIFSAIFSYLSLSSFFARLSLIAWIRRCAYPSARWLQKRIALPSAQSTNVPDALLPSPASSPFPWPSPAPSPLALWPFARRRTDRRSGERPSSAHAIAFRFCACQAALLALQPASQLRLPLWINLPCTIPG